MYITLHFSVKTPSRTRQQHAGHILNRFTGNTRRVVIQELYGPALQLHIGAILLHQGQLEGQQIYLFRVCRIDKHMYLVDKRATVDSKVHNESLNWWTDRQLSNSKVHQ